MSAPLWLGVLDADDAGPGRQELADAARDGDWPRTVALAGKTQAVNGWRPGGPSLYAPLHQAAHRGAPADVVRELLALGAWRTLRTARGERPVDLAVRKGHHHLVDLLQPQVTVPADPGTLALLDHHLAALVESRIRPHLPVRLRHPSTEVLTELGDDGLWYPVPGMHGGFHVRLREEHLYVRSWCRVVGGSGQAHVVTREGSVLVDEGFV